MKIPKEKTVRVTAIPVNAKEVILLVDMWYKGSCRLMHKV